MNQKTSERKFFIYLIKPLFFEDSFDISYLDIFKKGLQEFLKTIFTGH